MSRIFGERLKNLRLQCNLYQLDIAEELKITMQAVSAWERGLQEPSVDNILKLCDILNTTPNYLLGYCDECQEKPTQKPIKYTSDIKDLINDIKDLDKKDITHIRGLVDYYKLKLNETK